MKHCIAFKLLALILCTASLLGIIGGGAGALVLAENDLYNRTVDELIQQRVQNLASESATQIASRYADQFLGGCPEEISRYSGSSLLSRNFAFYGYSVLDAEGKVLASLNPELKDHTQVHSVPITGQYMHLVSLESETEKLARETAARIDSIGRVLKDQTGQTVPAGGTPVNTVIFTDSLGTPIYEAVSDPGDCHSIFYYGDGNNVHNSRYDHEPQQQIGFLYYGINGQLIYRSFLQELDHNFSSAEVCGVLFLSHENGFLFQAEDPEGLGILTFEDGHLVFTGYSMEETAEETLPEETVPETAAVTVPPETTEETLAAEETSATEEVSDPEDSDEETSENTEEENEETPDDSEEEDEETQPQEEEDGDEEHEEEEDSSASDVPEDEDYSEEDSGEEESYSDEEDSDSEEEYTEEDEHDVQDSTEESSEDTAEASTEETIPPVTEIPETLPEETVLEEIIPAETEPLLINGKPLETYQINRTEYTDRTTGEHTTAKYIYLPMPELTIEVYVNQDALRDVETYNVLRTVRQYRSYLLPVIGVCLLLFILCSVYLCTAAGRSPGSDEVCASGLNRLPLDLYLLLSAAAISVMVAIVIGGTPFLLSRDFLLGCSLAVTASFLGCLALVAFVYAFVAQVKTGGGYWWRNTLSVRFVFLFMRLVQRFEKWLRNKGFSNLTHCVTRIWQVIWKILVRLYTAIEKITVRTGEKLNYFFSLMPLTWQWVVAGMVLLCLLLIACNTHSTLLTLICLTASLALIFLVSHCFGVLLESTRKMSKGDLDTTVDDRLMIGCFKDFADDLNNLADVAMVAAQNQLKSERMKTELITNVSHDIKTPLTSIINYVDLLQKPHTEEEARQYLQVLDHQSQRLKKLVEDLMDMSKASTGNMTVEITKVDAVESVNQALGEFADKLEQARLYPVFRHIEDSVPMMADGKLVWRVLSNLLGNVVKYGMPGTRIYLDLAHVNGKVIISLKNISREELNVTAEELMERFVRGDVSRNTEGSGLGLNIAKSLMELQKGHLQLLVDGDLFKVTLIFPDAD